MVQWVKAPGDLHVTLPDPPVRTAPPLPSTTAPWHLCAAPLPALNKSNKRINTEKTNKNPGLLKGQHDSMCQPGEGQRAKLEANPGCTE